ncbi:uncharacterized protein [Pocillopora verrucosa]|uniref:uncharacterized protein n=1 Tax=Pocillopora verrucosa TaxID=203993 RepID=UPI003340ED75
MTQTNVYLPIYHNRSRNLKRSLGYGEMTTRNFKSARLRSKLVRNGFGSTLNGTISQTSNSHSSGKRGRKRCGGYGFGGCGGCGGLGGYGGYGGFGGCGGYGFGLGGLCDWCADGTMCANCKGGFGPPIGCGGCNCGCSPSLTFPCVFGASVNNPGCECCKKKPPKGKCIWPCMWPCCCECDPPKFKFKPLEPKPVCHCPHKRYYRLHQSQTNNQGPVKRNLLDTIGGPFPKVFAPFSFPIVNGLQIKPQGFLQVSSNSEPNQPV